MKTIELKKLDINKLQEKLAEFRNKSRELNFSIANNQLKKVRELRVIKKDIARILTILNGQRIEKNSASSKEELKDNQAK
ncbi:MAG: 50S ribosomal protein L29 [bacterium]|nr:50S ribosomal protein L29 [bacterium]